jgi:hypothetical protein
MENIEAIMNWDCNNSHSNHSIVFDSIVETNTDVEEEMDEIEKTNKNREIVYSLMSCKRIHETTVSYLEHVIHLRENILPEHLRLLKNENRPIEDLEEQIKCSKEKIEFISMELLKKCVHEWVEDWIDLTVDTSQQIKYCKYCETNK